MTSTVTRKSNVCLGSLEPTQVANHLVASSLGPVPFSPSAGSVQCGARARWHQGRTFLKDSPFLLKSVPWFLRVPWSPMETEKERYNMTKERPACFMPRMLQCINLLIKNLKK